ncbi:pyrroline-5-carboxylate reductase [Candidatus Woesearchaeota archaeon]|nr:pyrroline-5-carboxylate reductase [Candidatus Woesearchaeota archaeon]
MAKTTNSEKRKIKTNQQLNIKLGFIGTGRMATALIKSILNSKLISPKSIYCSDVKKENLNNAHIQFKINLSDNLGVCTQADIIFLCVKPQDIVELLKETSKNTKNKLVVSIAACITLATLESHLKNARIIRVMPNIPCLVGEMAAVYALGKKATGNDKQILLAILSAAGRVFELNEELFPSATALSGCGPAFFAYFIDGFVKAAIKQGLQPDIALQLAEQTCLGTGKLLLETKMQPAELIKMVASPNGVTEAALKVFEQKNVKSILNDTIQAAIKRTNELAQGK